MDREQPYLRLEDGSPLPDERALPSVTFAEGNQYHGDGHPDATPGMNGVAEVPEHCHTGLKTSVDKRAERQLLIVTVLCLFFMIGEFIGGYFADSLAVMTDAAHMLTDFASFLISLVAIWIARRPATTRLSFGYYRAEVLGALISIITIWVLTGVLVYLAIERTITMDFNIESHSMLSTFAGALISIITIWVLTGVLVYLAIERTITMDFNIESHSMLSTFAGALISIITIWVLTGVLVYLAIERTITMDFNIEPLPMLITSACGVAFNIIMALVLHKSGHGHSHGGHGHSHGRHDIDSLSSSLDSPPPGPIARTTSVSVTAYPMEEIVRLKKQRNINVRAAFIHVIGDLIQSVGILIGALIIKFKPEWKLADPICTFLFSVLVLTTTLTVMRDIIRVLMEAIPPDVNYHHLKEDLLKIDGVVAVHDLHVWSLTMDKGALAVHLAIRDNEVSGHKVMATASRMIRTKYSVMFTTIQVEPYIDSAMAGCQNCKGPLLTEGNTCGCW